MTTKTRIALLLILSLILPLCLSTSSLAVTPPNVIGNWSGTAPKVDFSASCFNAYDIVTLTITKQCTNLVSGTIMVGNSGTLIPVVGRLYSGSTYSLSLSGECATAGVNFTSYEDVGLNGTYVPGTTPSISVNSFYHYNSADINTQNQEYDTFSLIHQ